ncbi:MAG: endonuclease/exonuclease/phosphatase family protein [Caldilineaceae bacterium]|nr:endonuclease/exonuclease/phosphatase family protein [Caldilineaceae bacterium]
MRFATYNIWNSPTLRDKRHEALITALLQLGADVVAIQEVPTAFGTDTQDAGAVLAKQSNYPYSYFRAYPHDPDEGLALLSCHPLNDVGAEWDEPCSKLPGCAIGAAVLIAGYHFSLVNLHLDWSSIAVREHQITRLVAWHTARKASGSFSLLCGDFNAIPESSIYRFLQGQQSLQGVETQPWIDLAAYDAFVKGKAPVATLDFMTNPRWANTPRLDVPMRVDWLMLGAEIAQELPRVQTIEVFGVEPLAPSHVVPSDHYGVYADLSFT